MPSAGFEPAIAAVELLKNCVLDRTDPGSARTDTETCMIEYGVCTMTAAGSEPWNNKTDGRRRLNLTITTTKFFWVVMQRDLTTGYHYVRRHSYLLLQHRVLHFPLQRVGGSSINNQLDATITIY